MSLEDYKKEIEAAWSTGQLSVPVANCKACPFFGRTLVSAIASGGDMNAGECRAPCPKLGGGILLGRPLPVTDNRVRPTWCPLRMGDITVTATD